MTKRKQLNLYEEIMLLALRDEEGTIATGYSEHVVAGAILAELLLDQQISIEDTRKQLVDLQNTKPTGDPIIDECLERIVTSKRRRSLQTWISRLAGTKDLRHKVARRLCDRGILRADLDKVLFVFTRQVYPEIDPLPEKKIVERLRTAIFTDRDEVDPRTVMLISLANGAELLNKTFGRKEVRGRRKRIEQIVNGELTGKATKQVIAACQTALMVAAIMPAMITASIHH
jgi:hypothetical protein